DYYCGAWDFSLNTHVLF
nr:immunoglobulin light chain junction region [Macaca mulatta]